MRRHSPGQVETRITISTNESKFLQLRNTPAFNERHRAGHVAAFEVVCPYEFSGQLDEGPFRLLNIFSCQHQEPFDTSIRHRLNESGPFNALHDRCALVVFFELENRAIYCEAKAEENACDRFLPGWHGLARGSALEVYLSLVYILRVIR